MVLNPFGYGDGQRALKSIVAIANSGFPEAEHSQTALEVCRLFARQVGFDWAGGLAMGGGGMVSGQPLAELGAEFETRPKP